MAELLALLVLLAALIVAGCVQVAAALGVMYGMHKKMREKLTQTTYGEFDFDNFQKPAFNELLARLACILMGPTLVLHMLQYLLQMAVPRMNVKAAPFVWSLVLLVLETVAIGVGFHLVLKLDGKRLKILTASSAVLYLLLLWVFLLDKLH